MSKLCKELNGNSLQESAQIYHKQVQFCQNSQILRHCRYHHDETLEPEVPLRKIGKKDRRELKLLQVIALCLSTGKQGEVIAAAFDKRPPLRVVLSKNRPISSIDEQNASTFFTALLNPQSGSHDLIAVIAKYGGESMAKQIAKIAKSLSEVREYLEQRLNDHRAGPLSLEFRSKSFVKMMDGASTHQALRVVLQSLSAIAIDIDMATIASTETQEAFMAAPGLATILVDVEFISNIIDSFRCPSSVLTFHRRLTKFALYDGGLNRLIKYRKRMGGGLRIQLASVPDLDSPIVTESAPTALEIACQAKEMHYSEDRFYQRYPTREWMSRVDPSLHAEVRLILFMEGSGASADGVRLRLISFSKRCLCCRHWVESYNVCHEGTWLLAGLNGKLDMEWRIPNLENVVGLLRSLSYRAHKVLAWMETENTS